MKNAIIDAAREVFLRYGFFKTTMEDISKSVRKGKSSLYYYFKNKEEIFLIVVEEELKPIREKIEQILESNDTPQHKIINYLKYRMEILQKIVNLYSKSRYEYFENYVFIENLRKKYDIEECGFFERLLNDGKKKGVFDIADVQLTSKALISAVKGYEFPWVVEEGGVDIQNKMKALLDILFYGILKR